MRGDKRRPQSAQPQPDNGNPSATISEENAWDVLEELTGTVVAPADWAEEHDHYLSGTPKRRLGDPIGYDGKASNHEEKPYA